MGMDVQRGTLKSSSITNFMDNALSWFVLVLSDHLSTSHWLCLHADCMFLGASGLPCLSSQTDMYLLYVSLATSPQAPVLFRGIASAVAADAELVSFVGSTDWEHTVTPYSFFLT